MQDILAKVADRIDFGDGGLKLTALALAALGALKVANVSLKSVQALLKYFVLPRMDLTTRYGKGSWAVVTGASDGLGRQYATELAAMGFNLVLFGRNQIKLELVAAQLYCTYGTKTYEVVHDFSKLWSEKDAQDLQQILENMWYATGCDISVLVNNVGVLPLGPLAESSIESVGNAINVNVNAQTYMSALILPYMLARCKETGKRCALINISSKAAFFTRGYMPLYCATKRYNMVLS